LDSKIILLHRALIFGLSLYVGRRAIVIIVVIRLTRVLRIFKTDLLLIRMKLNLIRATWSWWSDWAWRWIASVRSVIWPCSSRSTSQGPQTSLRGVFWPVLFWDSSMVCGFWIRILALLMLLQHMQQKKY
jgi:hypothetical protein